MHIVSNIYIDFFFVVGTIGFLPSSIRKRKRGRNNKETASKVTLTVYQGDRSVVNLFYSVTGNK